MTQNSQRNEITNKHCLCMNYVVFNVLFFYRKKEIHSTIFSVSVDFTSDNMLSGILYKYSIMFPSVFCCSPSVSQHMQFSPSRSLSFSAFVHAGYLHLLCFLYPVIHFLCVTGGWSLSPPPVNLMPPVCLEYFEGT